ncbi:MAG: hypothetical protein AB7R89_10910 [Dehalococcoidia bacterium]
MIIDGTGPTGPIVVNGVLDRGYEVTIMHSGFHEVEFDQSVDMSWDLAAPCHVLWRNQRDHHVRDTHKIQDELGYRDVVPADDAVKRVVDWLMDHRPARNGEEELQLGDPFNYAQDDALVCAWKSTRASMPAIDYPLPTSAHTYRHQVYPNEP